MPSLREQRLFVVMQALAALPRAPGEALTGTHVAAVVAGGAHGTARRAA